MRDFAKFMHWCRQVRPHKCKWDYTEIVIDIIAVAGILGIIGGLLWLSL